MTALLPPLGSDLDRQRLLFRNHHVTKHPIKTRRNWPPLSRPTLHGGQVCRTPSEVLLISRVHAKLLISSKEESKGRREPPSFLAFPAAKAVIRGIGGRRDLSNQPPRVTLMT